MKGKGRGVGRVVWGCIPSVGGVGFGYGEGVGDGVGVGKKCKGERGKEKEGRKDTKEGRSVCLDGSILMCVFLSRNYL